MNYYVPTLIITILLMITMIVQAHITDAMSSRMKTAFFKGFTMVAVCSILDFFRLTMNGSDFFPLWLHSLVVSLEYAVAPFTVLCLIGLMGEFKHQKLLLYLFIFNAVLQMTTGFTELIFYIDEANYFVRGDWFRLYVLIYAIGIIIMYREVYRCSQVYQNCNGMLLLLSICSLTIGVGMNEFVGEFYTTFLAVAIAATMFYLYFVELSVQTDPLTKLLNRRSYNNRLKKLNYPTGIVMFDVNKFKHINDTYGHDMGDFILKEVSRALRRSFVGIGYVYRLGGDEFCLICHKNTVKTITFEQLRCRLEQNLVKARLKCPLLPSVSMGYAEYDGTEKIDEVLNRADRNMYVDKNGQSSF